MDGNCRSCGARLIWAVTASGRTMPVDYEPHEEGNLRLKIANGLTYVEVVAQHARGQLHRPHFATCPDADSWRKR